MKIRQHPPAPKYTSGTDNDPRWNAAPCTDLDRAFLWDLELDNNGQWGLAETREERRTRHTEAISLCHDCPALPICKARPGQTGVIAGKVVTK